MKTRYTLILMLFLKTATTYGLTDSIPNGGFERWFTTTWFDFPAEWITNNNQITAAGVNKDLDPYSGTLALGLNNYSGIVPVASCYFPVSLYHTNVGGYVKNHLPNNDSAVFTIRMFYFNTQVDSGEFVFWGGINPNYHPFIIPISQHSPLAPDSCTITISGGQNFNASISFDDLQFDFVLGIPDIEKGSSSVYPNPSTNGTYYYSTQLTGKAHCSIIDIAGKIVEEIDAVPEHDLLRIDTKLTSGIYVLRIEQNGYRSTHRLLKL